MSNTNAAPNVLVVHATSVAYGESAALIRGASGSGKSDLALRFLSEQAAFPSDRRPRRLIADDQTELRRDGDHLIARCPPTIIGKLEVRGLGIVPITATRPQARVRLLVDLVADTHQVPRMPLDSATDVIMGVAVPRLCLYPFEASAALKLALALARIG